MGEDYRIFEKLLLSNLAILRFNRPWNTLAYYTNPYPHFYTPLQALAGQVLVYPFLEKKESGMRKEKFLINLVPEPLTIPYRYVINKL